MRTMLIRAALCSVLALSAVGNLFAEPEKASHIVVLKSGKSEEKPNFPALGAKVVYEWGRRVVIDAPEQAVEGLRRNPHVKYVQRLQPVDGAGDHIDVEADENGRAERHVNRDDRRDGFRPRRSVSGSAIARHALSFRQAKRASMLKVWRGHWRGQTAQLLWQNG